jgi:succinate dehydrogenase/fumarate reductase cytochrome b subunit
MTQPRVDRTQIEIKRKLRMQLVDRLVGWFTMFCYFYPLIGRYLNAQGKTNFNEGSMQTFSNLFWVMIFLHSIAALYLYGIPLFKKSNLRIVNLYLGIAILAIIFVNRSMAVMPMFEKITATLMIIPAVFHALIGIRLFLQRLLRKQWDKPIPFYTGGNISRDV